MKRVAFKSIRTRLIFWFFVLGLAPLFVGIVATYYQQEGLREKKASDKLVAIRDLKAQQLENWIDEKEFWMKSISEDKEFQVLEQFFQKKEFNKSDSQTLANMRRILRRHLVNFDDFFELSIINKYSREVIVSTNSDSEGMDENEDPSLTEYLALKGMHIKDIHLCRHLNAPAMSFSIPIHCIQHKGSHVIGILVGRIDLEKSLYAVLQNRIGLGETGETLIVNKDGKVLNKLRWYENAPLKLRIHTEATVNAIQGKTGIVKITNYRDKEVLSAYTYIPQINWGFLCEQDLSEIDAPIRKLVRNLSILFLIAMALIFLIVFRISQIIAKPIVDMSATTRKIRGGDYSVRHVVGSVDEIGFLASSINEMTASIEFYTNIQKGVADISETMIGRSSTEEFASELLKQLMEITGSNMSAFYILNEEKSQFEHFTSVGANKELLTPFDAKNPEGEFGYAVSNKKIYYIQDLPEDTLFTFKTVSGDAIPREVITIPVVDENKILAIISLANLKKYSAESLDILNRAWNLINASYANLSASVKTRRLAEGLKETNQKLEAQSEELQAQSEEIQQASMEMEKQNVELEYQSQQVETANRLKSEFLSNMSHELRTPLNSIMALSRVLIRQAGDKLSEEELNFLEIIDRNGKKLLGLINDILDLAKIESGRMDVSLKLFPIGSAIKTVIERLESIAEEKGIEINRKIPDNLPQVKSDEAMVDQILQNLVSNAVKFTEKGLVTVLAHSDAENIHIAVADTGIGILKKDLPYIFQKFRQVDGTPARQYEGAGLGLAIAYKAAQVLGGDLTVESVLGKGTKFTLTLPIKRQEIIPDAASFTPLLLVDDVEKTGRHSELKQGKAANRILLVEDNEADIIQVRKVLESEGYRVDVVNGGQKALDYVKGTIPDGIILDLMMPDVDGFEVLNNIRVNKATEKIPVLILTAKDLSPGELKRLKGKNVRQLNQKGNVARKILLNEIRLMLEEPSRIKPEEKTRPFDIQKREFPPKAGTNGKPMILVVEDNPDNMITMKAILHYRYNLLEATDGKKGLKIALTERPDLILLDMSLPEMDGFTVAGRVKADRDARHIPVIALTAMAMKGDREKILKAGCDDYISKPIDAKNVLKKIEDWLQN